MRGRAKQGEAISAWISNLDFPRAGALTSPNGTPLPHARHDTKWMNELQLAAEDKTKSLSGNAKRLLKM